MAQEIINGLVHCVKGKRFGELLSLLQIQEDKIRPIYAGVSSRHLDDAGDGKVPVVTSGAAVDKGFMEALFGDAANVVSDEDNASEGATPGLGGDRASAFVDELVNSWTNSVLAMPGDAKIQSHLMVDEAPLRKLAQELVKGFERTNQRDLLTAAVRQETSLATTNWDKAGERVGLVMRMMLGQYMSFLDMNSVPEAARPKSQIGGVTRPVFAAPAAINDMPNLPEKETMNQTYLGDWFGALRGFIISNADFQGGGELTDAQNRELAKIMSRVAPKGAEHE